MARTAFQKRLWSTPLRDLLRGRVTGRLDWRTALSVSGLGDGVCERIAEVVQRTKLWRLEQASVAAELIGHFQDAADAGVSESEALDAFGDAKYVAKLIRRAKRRQRSIAWQGGRTIGWLLVGIAGLYAISLAQYLLGRPTPKVDYVAQLNAAALAVPEDQRAMPVYREAVKQLRPWLWPVTDWQAYRRDVDVQNATPRDPLWPQTTAWLKQSAPQLVELRRAASMPELGLVRAPEPPGEINPDLDTPVGWLGRRDASLLTAAAELLAKDARLATLENDGGRLIADLDALLGVARHARVPHEFLEYTAWNTTTLALASIERALVANPSALSDDQWIALAHRLAALGDNPSLDTTFADARFGDLLQYTYTDDGHGDGRPTWEGWRRTGARSWTDGRLSVSTIASQLSTAAPVAIAGAGIWLESRAAAKLEYERLQQLAKDQLRRPVRESDWTEYLAARDQWAARRQRLLAIADPIASVPPIDPFAQQHWEAGLGYRDGITVGIALELFHRRHGRYPKSLNELVPNLLPAVPADRVDGQPARYKLINGRPLVYSVGVDGQDDGGLIPFNVGKDPYDSTAPVPKPLIPSRPAKGDWALYPRPEDFVPADRWLVE